MESAKLIDVKTLDDDVLRTVVNWRRFTDECVMELRRRQGVPQTDYFEMCKLPARDEPAREPSIRKTSKAACPNCGKSDALASSRTMYDSPSLARHGGKAIGTCAICKCGAWFNADTGQPVNPAELYTY